MRKNRRWKGDLARPIRIQVHRPYGFAIPDPTKDPEAGNKIRAENKLMERLRDEKRAQVESLKLELLAKHYDVPLDDFRALALAVARDLIPGFQFIDPLRPLTSYGAQYPEKIKSGRPAAWDFDRLEELLKEVTAAKKSGSVTDREALARVARKAKWRPPANHRGGTDAWLETLESRLQDAKRQEKRIANALESLMEFHMGNSEKSDTGC
jgi:hypothetical protein